MIDNRGMAPQLDAWLTDPAVRVAHRRASTATPDRLWQAAQEIDLSDTRMLGRLVRWRIPGLAAETSFARLFRCAPFAVLDEGPEEFREWSKSGTAKVLFAHWVEADGNQGSLLRSEARVKAYGAQGRIGLASVRPLISGFQQLVASDALVLAVRAAERG
jgi:hypothetical protein